MTQLYWNVLKHYAIHCWNFPVSAALRDAKTYQRANNVGVNFFFFLSGCKSLDVFEFLRFGCFFPFFKKIWFLSILGSPGNHLPDGLETSGQRAYC